MDGPRAVVKQVASGWLAEDQGTPTRRARRAAAPLAFPVVQLVEGRDRKARQEVTVRCPFSACAGALHQHHAPLGAVEVLRRCPRGGAYRLVLGLVRPGGGGMSAHDPALQCCPRSGSSTGAAGPGWQERRNRTTRGLGW